MTFWRRVAARARKVAPGILTMLVRAVLIGIGAIAVKRGLATHAQVLALAASASPAIAALVWSAGRQVFASRRYDRAVAAPAGLARAPAPPPPPTRPPPPDQQRAPRMPTYAEILANAASRVKAEFEKLTPEVLAAMPADFQPQLIAGINVLASEAKTAADAEVDAATKQMPPAWEPLKDDLKEFLDAGITAAEAALAAKVQTFKAAQATIDATPSPAISAAA